MGDSLGPDLNIETFVIGDSSPTSVIPKEKPWYIQVTWQMTGSYVHIIDGTFVVHIYFESLGPVDSSSELPQRRLTVPRISEPDPVNYGPVNCEFEAHSLRAGVYRISAALTAIGADGMPSPIAEFAEKIIAVIPALDASGAADQAISTGIKVAAAEQAISTGVPVARENDNVATTSDGIEVKSSEGQSIVVPYSKAFNKIGDSTRSIDTQLQQINTEIRLLAQRWDLVSLSATVIGLILIGTGVLMLLAGYSTIGIVSMISSLIPETVAALCFVQSRKANQRVDIVRDQLLEIHVMISDKELIDKIEDSKSRDKLITEYVIEKITRRNKGA